MPRNSFDPSWLAARLTMLLPGYPGVRLCVALSGGADSTALLAALAAARPRPERLRAVHVEHGLHANAPLWRRHCRALARRLGVPLTVRSVQVSRGRGESLEAAARSARYDVLRELLAPGEVLLTAHHEDDQLETVLLQLFRGAGIAGLAAMPELAAFGPGLLARPLLGVPRTQLEAWLRAHELSWVEDDTNADERLDRNFLRRRIAPLIRARWPGAGRTVARSARHAAEAQRLLDALGRLDADRAAHGAGLSVRSLRTLGLERRRNAVRFWIARSGHPLPDTRRLEEIVGPMLVARPDANPFVGWGALGVQRHGDVLTLGPARSADAFEPLQWSWIAAPLCTLPDGLGALELARDPRGPVDLRTVPQQVTVRARAGGERLRPRRGGPSRTLKSLLQEAHIPAHERARLPLVLDGEKVLAVGDLWIDASIRAEPGAGARARLLWHRN